MPFSHLSPPCREYVTVKTLETQTGISCVLRTKQLQSVSECRGTEFGSVAPAFTEEEKNMVIYFQHLPTSQAKWKSFSNDPYIACSCTLQRIWKFRLRYNMQDFQNAFSDVPEIVHNAKFLIRCRTIDFSLITIPIYYLVETLVKLRLCWNTVLL